MPATLKEILLADGRRADVVADLQTLVDKEVAGKSGMSGFAIKGSYAVVKKVKSGFVPHAIDQMLPEFAHRLQPYYEGYDAHQGTLAEYLVANQEAVTDVLLGVADRRARQSSHETVRKAYQKLRPQAKKHVEHALPGLGDVVEQYAEQAEAGQAEAGQAEAERAEAEQAGTAADGSVEPTG